jgi:cold shock CspA family protein
MSCKIGKIKFYHLEKGFGFIIDNEDFYNEEIHCHDSKEYYFKKISLQYENPKKDDYVYFKTDDYPKDSVKDIYIINKEFLITQSDFLDYGLRCDLNDIIRKGLIKDFTIYTKELINRFTYKLNEIDIYDDLSFEREDTIDNYIDKIVLNLHIQHNRKVGDDDSLNIFYKLESLDNVFVPEIKIENFEYNLYSMQGYTSFYDIKQNFIANEKENCERIIPDVLAKIKKELKEKYKININKNYRHSLKYLFEQELYNSFFEIGIAKTIETIDFIFVNFKQQCKSSRYYTVSKRVVEK